MTHLGRSGLRPERVLQAQRAPSVYVYIAKPGASHLLCTRDPNGPGLSSGSEHCPLIEFLCLLQIPTPKGVSIVVFLLCASKERNQVSGWTRAGSGLCISHTLGLVSLASSP